MRKKYLKNMLYFNFIKINYSCDFDLLHKTYNHLYGVIINNKYLLLILNTKIWFETLKKKLHFSLNIVFNF